LIRHIGDDGTIYARGRAQKTPHGALSSLNVQLADEAGEVLARIEREERHTKSRWLGSWVRNWVDKPVAKSGARREEVLEGKGDKGGGM
jgi:hypothetical protein